MRANATVKHHFYRVSAFSGFVRATISNKMWLCFNFMSNGNRVNSIERAANFVQSLYWMSHWNCSFDRRQLDPKLYRKEEKIVIEKYNITNSKRRDSILANNNYNLKIEIDLNSLEQYRIDWKCDVCVCGLLFTHLQAIINIVHAERIPL